MTFIHLKYLGNHEKRAAFLSGRNTDARRGNPADGIFPRAKV
jgi:hypothetical protein